MRGTFRPNLSLIFTRQHVICDTSPAFLMLLNKRQMKRTLRIAAHAPGGGGGGKNLDIQRGPDYPSVLDELRYNTCDSVDGDCKAHSRRCPRIGENGGVDAHHPALRIQERPSAVACPPRSLLSCTRLHLLMLSSHHRHEVSSTQNTTTMWWRLKAGGLQICWSGIVEERGWGGMPTLPLH